MNRHTRRVMVAAGALVTVAGAWALSMRLAPPVAAGGLLHPVRRSVTQAPPARCEEEAFSGAGVTLKGWRCAASGRHRGTLVFLHGVADNRTSSAAAIDRFTALGLDVVAYDSRAHGESGGDVCTYGFWEKKDLEKVIDTIRAGPVVLLGVSLGAAVALQEAADDGRVSGVVAVEAFSDLETVARERAPRLMTDAMIRRAFTLAEAGGAFRVRAVSPVAAAARIRAPVLLIHGTDDTDTPPDHSRRLFAALAGPKELVLVAGARHSGSLRSADTWTRVERWVDGVVRAAATIIRHGDTAVPFSTLAVGDRVQAGR